MITMCCNTKKQTCDSVNYKELNLKPVNTVLKLPNYIVTDTVKYGDVDNIFEYKVKSIDSSFVAYAGVKSYDLKPDAMPDIIHRMTSQKEQVESGQSTMLLLIETFKNIDGVKVGYLKYLDQKRSRYEGRIFFYKGKKFVDIWLFEKYNSEKDNSNSTIDCVLGNINIKT